MNNIRYKCLWCDFDTPQIRGLKYHVQKMHLTKKYSNLTAGRILRGTKGNITHDNLLVASVSYSPIHTDVKVREYANSIIQKYLSYTVLYNPLHFA